MIGFRQKQVTGSQGFTLFEALLAITLSGLVIAFLAGSYIESVHTQQALSGRITALLLGRSKLAELVQNSEPASSGVFDKPYAQFQWSASDEKSPDLDIQTVLLTVKWRNENGAVRQVQLQAYRNPE